MEEKHGLMLARLLATRLCHDLAGPLGGMNNGVEFLKDSLTEQSEVVGADNSMVAQSVDLLALSAGEGAAKLQLFRQAYGIINQVGGETEINALGELLTNYFTHGKISVAIDSGELTVISHEMRQLVVNCVMLVSSQLLSGGKVDITLTSHSFEIVGSGGAIKQDGALECAFVGDCDLLDLNPQLVPAFFTYLLAREVKFSIDYSCDAERVVIAATAQR